MSVLWRILSLAALAVSAGVLFLSILSVRKEQRVRPALDLLRLGVTLVTTLVMARLLGVDSSEALMGLGLVVGLLLGVYEGLHLRVRFLGQLTFARRTVLGVAAWGVGVVLVQAAGVIGRIGLADFGLALSFLGIGQVVGLLTGRWQTVLTARRVSSGAVAALVLLASGAGLFPGLMAPARAADVMDVRAVAAGEVPGLAVEVRGNGAFFGAALSLTFTNETGSEVLVAVPVGLLFIPDNEATQTMVAAGGETLVVPSTQRGGGHTTQIQAFCGQYHDEIPSTEDVFTTGEMAAGQVATLVTLIHQEGVYGRDQQEAIWQVTDGYDISQNPAAEALVETAAEGWATDAPVAGVDDDPGNLLWDCATNRTGFGDPSEDRSRCVTFRYDVPEGGIESAVVYLSIEAPTGSLQDTDSVGVAVGTPFPEQCGLAGGMPGCVLVHGGFAGGERSLTTDLLNLACDASYSGTQGMQDAVRAQLETGVLHLVLQDDTAVLAARLAVNEGPPALPCGTSAQVAPVPCHCNQGNLVLSAGEGARTSIVGLGGAAALLLTALAGSGHTLASASAALRIRGVGGLRELLGGGSSGGAAPDWVDPHTALAGGRARAALENLPAGLRPRVQEVLAARLEAEKTEALLAEVRAAVGPLDPAADAVEVLRTNPKASGVLDRLPAGVRLRLEEKVLAGLQEQQAAGAAEEAARALRRDHAVEVVRRAISGGDGSTVQRALAALDEGDRARVWPRATAGLDLKPGDLDYPPPAPTGAAAPPAFDLEAYLDTDSGSALAKGGEAEAVLARLPAGIRSAAEGRLEEQLKAGRVSRWADKLRAVIGSGAGAGEVADSVLEVPEVQRLLGLLPPGLREQIGAQAGRIVDGEAVARWASAARRLVEEERAVDLLRAALGLNDGDGAAAVMDAVGAALDVTNQADLERLASRAVPGGADALARLARTGAPAARVDLTEHLAGEADLVGAACRVEGVEDLLQRAGSLRPQVEAELARVLEGDRVSRAVRRATEMAIPGDQADDDVAAARRELPGARELFGRLPEGTREVAYRMLGERLDAARIEAGVEGVDRARRLDHAERTLRRAVAAGDLDAADRALAGLSPEQAQEVSVAALGGGPASLRARIK